MKNKEIEELLNDLKKTADTSFFAVCSSKEELEKMPRGVCKFLTLNDKKAKLLLSYIEELEKDKKELKDGWQQEIYDKNKVLNDWLEDERKINILKNNRDKALKIIDSYELGKYDYSIPAGGIIELREALKGGSHE